MDAAHCGQPKLQRSRCAPFIAGTMQEKVDEECFFRLIAGGASENPTDSSTSAKKPPPLKLRFISPPGRDGEAVKGDTNGFLVIIFFALQA